jgi:hypothetical protein
MRCWSRRTGTAPFACSQLGVDTDSDASGDEEERPPAITSPADCHR